MKKFLIVLSLSLYFTSLFAQQDTTQTNEKSKPVRFTFGTGILIENQTIVTPFKGQLEMEIHHRFSLIKNYHDLFGIYGSANTRIGLNYGITDRLMIGVGTTKDYQLQDIQWKYQILQQKEDNSMPLSVAYYGNLVIDARSKDVFGPEASYKSIHRLSYFTEIIFARKLTDKISLQIAPSLTYYNSVPQTSDSTGYKNLNLGLSAGARINVFGNQSLILEYDQLLTKQNIDIQPKPNLSFGWEIGTATHTFQIFATNYNQIINQRNLVFNTNDFKKGEYLIGFNITIRF